MVFFLFLRFLLFYVCVFIFKSISKLCSFFTFLYLHFYFKALVNSIGCYFYFTKKLYLKASLYTMLAVVFVSDNKTY